MVLFNDMYAVLEQEDYSYCILKNAQCWFKISFITIQALFLAKVTAKLELNFNFFGI